LWLGLVFVITGLFGIYEALRGWSLTRAFALKSKI
jgi:hypothetical protein